MALDIEMNTAQKIWDRNQTRKQIYEGVATLSDYQYHQWRWLKKGY